MRRHRRAPFLLTALATGRLARGSMAAPEQPALDALLGASAAGALDRHVRVRVRTHARSHRR
jgi:hypothetical protein